MDNPSTGIFDDAAHQKWDSLKHCPPTMAVTDYKKDRNGVETRQTYLLRHHWTSVASNMVMQQPGSAIAINQQAPRSSVEPVVVLMCAHCCEFNIVPTAMIFQQIAHEAQAAQAAREAREQSAQQQAAQHIDAAPAAGSA